MVKRSIAGYAPHGIASLPDFNDAEVDSLIAAAGGLPEGQIEHQRLKPDGSEFEDVLVDRRTALTERLAASARVVDWDRQQQTKPTGAQLEQAFCEIAQAAERLLAALRVPSHGDIDAMPDALRYGGLQATAALEKLEPGEFAATRLRRNVAGVAQIASWARALAQRNRPAADTKPRRGREADEAMNEWVRSLMSIYFDVFGRVPVTGVNSERADGPFVRFMVGASRLIGQNITAEAVRERFRALTKPARKGRNRSKKGNSPLLREPSS